MSVLLDWITTKPNYARFNRGTRNNITGETKYAISMEVVNAIMNAGIITPRTQEAVIAKISQLETDYDEAHDWFAGVGSTVTNESTIKAAILTRCRYYYDLYDVMQDRALSNVALTSSQACNNGSSTHHDHNHIHNHNPSSTMMSTQQNHNSSSYKDPMNLDTGSETGMQQEGEDRSDSDDATNNVAQRQNICSKKKSSKKKKRKRRSRGSLSRLRKKAKAADATFDYHELRDPSHKIMTEWLKANSEINCEGMKEKAESCRLEERKLKREMKSTQHDCDMHMLKKQKMQMELAMELARNRMELRDNGVPAGEIDILLPVDFLHDKASGSINSESESESDRDSDQSDKVKEHSHIR